MRKTPATLAVLALSAVALSGCSGTAAFNGIACDRASATSDAADLVTVSGEFGSAPDVEMFSPIAVTETSYTDVIVGDDGPALTAAGQLAVVEMALYNGETGEFVVGTEFDGTLNRLSNISSWAGQIPGIGSVLECATAGTRMVAAIAPEDFGAASLTGFGLAEDTTVVAVIDVIDTKLARATGSTVFNATRGLPTVVRAADGRPGVIVPDGAAPDEVVTQTLIAGEGAATTADERVWVHYTAVGWDDRTVISTTWDGNPVSDLASTAPAVAEEIAGAAVGSQLLVVVPAEGEGSSTAYVVDIVGTSPAAES